MSLHTRDYDYHLPEELIASHPLPDRAASRMMVVHRDTQTIEHRHFRNITEYLKPSDLLVLNDTKVIPARLFSDDGKSELLCLDRLSPTEWRCLAKPGKRLRLGKSLTVGGITGTATAFTLAYSTQVVIYPTVVQAKPVNIFTIPAFFPVMFELTILFSGFTVLFGLLVSSSLHSDIKAVFLLLEVAAEYAPLLELLVHAVGLLVLEVEHLLVN
jgi:hypothetical protein